MSLGWTFGRSRLASRFLSPWERSSRRETAYRGDEPPVSVAGKIAILVNDGIATGASLLAGIRALRQLRPAVVATGAFAGLRSGELGGLEWTDYSGDALNVKRSVWRTFVRRHEQAQSLYPSFDGWRRFWMRIEVRWVTRNRM
jgi:hypothetical protein